MSLSHSEIGMLAQRLLTAHDEARTIPKISDEFPHMSVADGYAIQHAVARRRIERGDRVVGHKAGLTSKVKMAQMGIDVPSFGVLTNAMACPESSEIAMSTLIHPKLEAEIAFVMNKPLRGPDCTIDEVIAATDFVMPAIEVIDSRYERFKFDLVSVIADNSSSGRYVAGGRPMRADAIDLRTVGVAAEKNGEIVALGAGAAVLNHPANAVILLVRHLHALEQTLEAGSYVMTGSITEAVPVASGDFFAARFQDMGSVSVRFV